MVPDDILCAAGRLETDRSGIRTRGRVGIVSVASNVADDHVMRIDEEGLALHVRAANRDAATGCGLPRYGEIWIRDLQP